MDGPGWALSRFRGTRGGWPQRPLKQRHLSRALERNPGQETGASFRLCKALSPTVLWLGPSGCRSHPRPPSRLFGSLTLYHHQTLCKPMGKTPAECSRRNSCTGEEPGERGSGRPWPSLHGRAPFCSSAAATWPEREPRLTASQSRGLGGGRGGPGGTWGRLGVAPACPRDVSLVGQVQRETGGHVGWKGSMKEMDLGTKR